MINSRWIALASAIVSITLCIACAQAVDEPKSQAITKKEPELCQEFSEYIKRYPDAVNTESPDTKNIHWLKWKPISASKIEKINFTSDVKNRILRHEHHDKFNSDKKSYSYSFLKLPLGSTKLDAYRFTPSKPQATEFCRFALTSNNIHFLKSERLNRQDSEVKVYSEDCRYFTYKQHAYAIALRENYSIRLISYLPFSKDIELTAQCNIQPNFK